MYGKFNTGYSLRYFRNNFERYYLQYMEGIQQMLSFGSIFRLDSTSILATELEMVQQQKTQCSIGYSRKIKNYEVMNSVNTRGGLKTLFNYAHN